MYRLLIAFLFFLVSLAGSAQSPAAARIRQRLQESLDSLQRVHRFPGATLAVVLPGGEAISLATGWSDSASRTPMQPDHRMPAGSIGKTFFAAPAVVLAERGVLGLDDKIEKYIGTEPWFNRLPNAGTITLRMLLNHSSGIEEYYELGDFMQRLKENPYKTWAPLETFSYIFDRKPLFAAGKGFGYADANYLILGYIVEKITGTKMYALAHAYALQPFRLQQTEPSLRVTYKGLATGYSGPASPFPFHGAMVRRDSLVFHPQFEWTGGGFVSGVRDLATWARELYHYRFASADSRRQMQQGVAANTGKNHLYGLGLQIRPMGSAGTGYGHSGWFPGYVSDMQYFSDADISLAIQFNTDDAGLLKKSTESYFLLFLSIIRNEPDR